MVNDSCHLGIDLGSISLKVVLLDERMEVVFSRWTRVAARPFEALSQAFRECSELHPDIRISSVGVTGSGRDLIADEIECAVVNEISAHATASDARNPDIRSIIEIGGQDSKLIILGERNASGVRYVEDFSMNELCAAGTGAFLDQQAARLDVPIEEFSLLANDSTDPAPIAGRCAVFAKTDMTHHQQSGRKLADIVAGLNEALARSYIANLVRGRKLPRPIAFQGGVASNGPLVSTFRKTLGAEKSGDLIVPDNHKIMGAIGAAIKGSLAHRTDTGLPGLQTVAKKAFEKRTHDITTGPHSSEPLKTPNGRCVDLNLENCQIDGRYLGIDVGSVSVKLAMIDKDGSVRSDYRFSDGKPIETLRSMLNDLYEGVDPSSIDGIGVTGSGRRFVGKLIGADAIGNEISAQAMAASIIYPGVDTVFEIGGQDAKFMRISDGRALHFSMNKVCAAGTGAFLQEQAGRLEIDIDGAFSEAAFASKKPADLGARCTVFMESDLVSHQQMGFGKNDIIAGLAGSVVSNYMEKVVAGHAIGTKPLFLGGVAENRAVVSALEAKAECPVATSSAGKISGAIGAALAAMEAVRKNGKRKAVGDGKTILEYEVFECDDCPNRCSVTRTATRPRRYFGGRCGKWDGEIKDLKENSASPISFRRDALMAPSIEERRKGPRVGIPMALMTFDMLPAWRTFFEELGCEVVLSPETDSAILEEGMKHLVVETCLPIKAFCSHLVRLEKEGVDFVFIPSAVIIGNDSHNKETAHCPYIQSLVQFAKPVIRKTPVLNPVINWKLDPDSERKEMEKLAKLVGGSGSDGKKAWNSALAAQRNFRVKLREKGDEVIAALKKGDIPRAFLILGKDYNVMDARLSSGITTILESKGEVVITQDMIASDTGEHSEAYRTMYWTHGKEMLAAAEKATLVPNLHPIQITSFGCGPDSFTTRFIKDIVKDDPLLVLEVDEHSSSVGMETRIEAFLDSIERRENPPSSPRRTPFSHEGGIERVFLPNFSAHGYAFAATFKVLGLEPILTPLPDDESARLGARYASCGECHPYVLMLGDFIKAVTLAGDLSNACYFMPESAACRVGQFGAQMRLAAEEMKVDLPVFTRVEELLHMTGTKSRILYVKALSTYWEMMRGMDFLMQKHLETRAYEIEPGSADRAHDEGLKSIMDSIMNGKSHEGLLKASALLDRVKTDRSRKKVRIGITGDYYTRICDYSNGNIFRDIERMGGVIMIPPTMSDFVKYDSRQKPKAALRHKKGSDFALSLAVRYLVDSGERRSRKIFGSDLDYDVPLEYNRAKELLAPYMDMKLPAGLTGSVAAILEQIRAGAEGIVSAITFHCNYGLAIGSVMKSIGENHPDIPMLTLIFEGLKPNHNKLRLEAFMERVCAKASRREER